MENFGSLQLSLIIGAGLVVLALATYAAALWYQVWQRKGGVPQAEETVERQSAQAMETANFNINLLLRALDQDQVSLTEGAIRIAAFLPALPEQERQSPWYLPFLNLAYAASHIPILDDWKALSREQKRKFDAERAELEDKHQQDILEAVRVLLKPEQPH